MSEAERCDAQLNVPLCVRRSAQSLAAKANAPLMFRSCSPVNQIPLRHYISPVGLFFLFLIKFLYKYLSKSSSPISTGYVSG